MRNAASSLFLLIFGVLITGALCVPSLGIQRDYGGEFNFGSDDGPHSYSGVIEFDDASIPGDSSKMSDGQFINLVQIAYNEMIDIWSNTQLGKRDCPGAMVGFESQGRIYFASSIKARQNVNFNAVDANVQGSVGWYQKVCQQTNAEVHRAGGACAEPNVLRLYGDVHAPQGSPPQYQAPPKNPGPRMAAIIISVRKGNPKTSPGKYALPCSDLASVGYGCETLVQEYGLTPVSDVPADTNGQDDWKFKTVTNPRGTCPAPKMF